MALATQILRAAVLDLDANVREEALKVLRAHDPRDALAALGQCLCSVETQLVLWALRVATGDELIASGRPRKLGRPATFPLELPGAALGAAGGAAPP